MSAGTWGLSGSRLEEVHLYCTPLAEDLRGLESLPHLERLSIQTQLITNKELLQLEQELRGVKLRTSDYTPTPFKAEQIALARLNRLHHGYANLRADGLELTWSRAPFTKANLEPLARVFPRLRVLRINDTTIDPAHLPDLKAFAELTHLHIGSRHVPVEFMQQVADLPDLERVSIYTRSPTLEPLLALKQHPPQTLYIYRPAYSDDELQVLREAFGERLQLGAL
jgi:hypothetical protein